MSGRSARAARHGPLGTLCLALGTLCLALGTWHLALDTALDMSKRKS